MRLDDRDILAQRAQRLAQPAVAGAVGFQELVVFELAGEAYALQSRCILAVFALRELIPLPGAEPGIVGITTWHGDLLTIVDLREALGVPEAALADRGKILVLGSARTAFGLVADAVRGILSVPVTEVRPLPDGVAQRRDLVRGITRDAVIVLDEEAVVRGYGTTH
ncbi:MAG TPA: chemotaxis protein CheW [Gemmatimonadaceae bacterium]|nr:chemotaxis protein CheW [Gemmatimonadaceae bacterium]